MTLEIKPARQQGPLPTEPYDRWVTPEGEVKAQFFRAENEFIMRFIDDADFLISHDDLDVFAVPTPQTSEDTVRDLYRNAVLPVITNHAGGLCLHGSAVSISGSGVAFVGRSRSGKTTLAAAFAKAGHAFLTEDVVELQRAQDQYEIQAKNPVLRLMPDSAAFLIGAKASDGREKQTYSSSETTPHSASAKKLEAIFILGEHTPPNVLIDRMREQQTLSELLQHSFILDVEDRRRLSAHFSRLADLVQSVPCYSLDYRREFANLHQVIAATRALILE